MPAEESVRFVYNEAAVVVTISGRNHLVIGDVHLGAEKKLAHKGIHVYNAVDGAVKKIRHLCKEFDAHDIIILGDVKDTILYPDEWEQREIRRFFKELEGLGITITAGNHDGHLGDIISAKIVDELILDGFAFMHGHKWPSDAAMQADYLFVGHNHIAVSITDKNKAVYTQKAWLVAKIDKKKAAEHYKKIDNGIKLVVLPAFNDLITGMPVNETEENLSPLFRNGIFDYKKAMVYSLRGDPLGTPSSLKKKRARP